MIPQNTSIPDIPPAWVIHAARAEIKKTNNWVMYLDVLCAYYQIPSIKGVVDVDQKKVPKIALAMYDPRDQTFYTKTEKISESTALHEFFHHLKFSKGLKISADAEDALANAFAFAISKIT